MGGAAFDLIVDHDAPKQHSIAVPTIDDGLAHVVDVAYANAPAEHPFEFISKGSNQQTQQLIERMREAMGDRYDSSLLPEFFNAYQAADGDWVDQALSARKAVEASMGIQLIQRRTSRYWYSPLLAELLLSAESFANTYNQILAGEDPGEDVHEPDRSVATLERINARLNCRYGSTIRANRDIACSSQRKTARPICSPKRSASPRSMMHESKIGQASKPTFSSCLPGASVPKR
ncbi:MAG: hypothetical protein R3E58_03845 [Phycisphaerae bacterium]